MSHVLTAIKNILAGQHFSLKDQAVGVNRINRQGEAFEVFMRRAFANDFTATSEVELTKRTQTVFSYASSGSNPPDLILRGGDAIEIKKFEKVVSTIQLNSSYPKAFLDSDYSLLTEECRKCEPNWIRKDLIYVLAVIQSKKIQEMWFVDGACYAASREVYESVFDRIKMSVHSSMGLEVTDSELGRIINVDPLQRTQLRIRGMWLMTHPRVAFASLFTPSKSSKLSIRVVLRESKYQKFIEQTPTIAAELQQFGCVIQSNDVLDPNNRAKVLAVKTLQFETSHA
jgi:hypothetical protein